MKSSALRGLVAALSLILILTTGLLAAEEKKDSPQPVVSTAALKLSGYTQARFTFDNFGPDTFQLYRARLGLEGEIFKNIRYKFLFEAARTPLLLDAMIEFTLVKNGFLRVGQYKVPFSQENLQSAASLDTINFSQIAGKLVPGRDNSSNGRDIGILANYHYATVDATVAVLNGSGINKADVDEKKDVALRLTWAPLDFLTVGASEYLGHTIPAAAGAPIYKRDRTGLELAVNYSDWMLKGEYIWAVDNLKDASGFYILGGYFILPKKLQAVVRYDTIDQDLDLDGNRNTIFLVGLNWFFTNRTKFQINCELVKPEGTNLDFSALLAQFQIGL